MAYWPDDPGDEIEDLSPEALDAQMEKVLSKPEPPFRQSIDPRPVAPPTEDD